MGDIAKAFLVGTSLPATAISFSYIGLANSRSAEPVENYELLPFIVPLVIGSANAASVAVSGRLPAQLAFGAATGLVMSFIGRAGFDMPSRIFGLQEHPWLAHIAAPVLYAGIFGLVLYPLNKWMAR